MKSLRWGVIGSTSSIYRRALKPAFQSGAAHSVVGEASRRDGGEQPYADLLGRADIDAIYIPLPNTGHKPWILRALAAGKHVLCEKPLTLSVADTEEVFAAAAAADRVLMEAYMWPHHPRARRVLQLIAGGELGDLRSVRSTFTYPSSDQTNHRFDERGAGALFDIGIYCLGPAMLMVQRDHVGVAAAAYRNTLGIDESMTGFVNWGAGVGNSFDVNFHAPNGRWLEVVGSNGVLTLDSFHVPGPEKSSKILIERLDGSTDKIKVEGANAFLGMADQFLAVIVGTEPPVFGAVESIRMAKVIEALHAAS
jgi:D-xylose 1-dehydrogenase (NADP+, D-xylono-1,5-lactone-forming)